MARRVLIPPLLAFNLALPSPQSSPDPVVLVDPEVLVDAERAFARDAAENGTRAAFLANLGSGSVVFEPGPVDARRTWEAREARPGLLSWEPEHAAISASGELGWTTGPWEFRPGGAEGDPVAFGEYATVWRREPDGAWKFAVDIGIPHGPHAGPPAAPAFWPVGPAPEPASTPADVLSGLLASERAFVTAAGRGIGSAYREHGGDRILLLRPGEPRAGGIEAAAALAARHPIEWQPGEAFVSDAGDLGAVYGVARAAGSEDGGYLRVWHRRPAGGWEIALDVATTPAPGSP